MQTVDLVNKKLDDCIEHFKTELAKIRTGRAQPAIVQQLGVEAYGGTMQLSQLASITVPDAKTIAIQPWDPQLIKNVEKAIRDSDLQLSPSVDGTTVRLSMPPLTEENRRALVKVVHERAEECRITIRQQREKTRSEIQAQAADGVVSEDLKFKQLKQLDEAVKHSTDRVLELARQKETEIMTL